ncbi:type II secretion system F family protein [Saliphagus infecundisoli]|uniref:Type II secretion system F family protein n=1 Tax=Saliphagus infecundisoli TaxID=1849069 RepID=A0ABD5QAC2_9EURY|nr:type II secretion system F family protein [Saliphagus infecundisoli]
MSVGTGDSGSGLHGGSDRLGELFYPLYDRLFDDDSKLVVDIERKLAQARMADTVELYLSRALGLGVISGVALWIGGLTLGYLLFATGLVRLTPMITVSIPNETVVEFLNTVYIPGLIVSTGLVFGTIGFLIGFSVLLIFPYSRAASRKREINMLLTDSVSFMYALSVGGLNQLEIIEAMAQADDTYGAVAEEFRSIVQETEYFDVDYRTAIRKQSMETPSDELSQFLTDMLAIVNSGGNMEGFLEDKKEKHMRTAKQQQEMTLETLELFGEMYMTLSLFPLLLIIIMVIMQMVPDANVDDRMLYLTIYGLIPLTGAGFLVLVSTVKHDEPGDGYLTASTDDKRVESARNQGLRNLGLVEEYTGEYSVFDRIKRNEGTHETIAVLRRPHHLFKQSPLLTLALTVPASLSVIGVAFVSDAAPTSWDAMIAYPIWGTLLYLYVPLYVIGLPLAVFREWNVRSRTAVIGSLSDDLRKLSSANDTGLTLLESLDSVARTTNGKLAREFETVHAKVNYGMSLTGALVEFNNAYHIPRLARTVKLITKAQEASNQISDVLRTAAQASENHDDIERERRSRTLMQVVIIIMTFLTLLAVIAILKTQFIDTVAGLETGVESGGAEDVDTGGAGVADANLAGNIDTDLLSLLFFHAVTLQAVLSGLICGYMRDADVLSGLKYVIVLSTIALGTWALVV